MKIERYFRLLVNGVDEYYEHGVLDMSKGREDSLGTGTLKLAYSDEKWKYWKPGANDLVADAGLYDQGRVFGGRTKGTGIEGNYIVLNLQDYGWKLKQQYTGAFSDIDIKDAFRMLISGAGMNPILDDIPSEKVSIDDDSSSTSTDSTTKQAPVGGYPNVTGSFLPSCSRCGKTGNHSKRVSTTIENYCPRCGRRGYMQVNPKGTAEGEFTCWKNSQGTKGCGADYCGYCGKEKLNSSSVSVNIVSGGSGNKQQDGTTSSEPASHSYEDVLKALCEPRMYQIITDQYNNCHIRRMLVPEKGHVLEPWMIGTDFKYTVSTMNSINKVEVEYRDGIVTAQIDDLVNLFGENPAPRVVERGLNKTQAEEYARTLLALNLSTGKVQASMNVLPSYKYRPGEWITFDNPKTGETSTMLIDNISESWNPGGRPNNSLSLIYSPPLPESESNEFESVGGAVGTLARQLGTKEAICRWVDVNIRYDFYYDHRYDPEEVLRLRIGNCSDQSDLVLLMWSAIGVQGTKVHTTCGSTGHYNVVATGRTCDPTCKSKNQM